MVVFCNIEFDHVKGFFINGKNLKLKGICMHHDAGALGSAVPEEEIARELAALINSLDRTRPVTASLASALMSNETGYADALDVAGYNYQESRYEPDHKKYPNRPLYGNENGMTLEM